MKSLSVLIVDDDRQMRGLMEAIFSRLEWGNIVVAPDGFSALDELKNQKFDLLFTDYNMPKMSGRDLIWRAKIIRPDMKIIMASGNNPDDLEEVKNSLKIDRIFRKPFNLDELCEALENLFP